MYFYIGSHFRFGRNENTTGICGASVMPSAVLGVFIACFFCSLQREIIDISAMSSDIQLVEDPAEL